VIPVKLMEYEGESLLSRSQAKRLIRRLDHFLNIIAINTIDDIKNMINYVK